MNKKKEKKKDSKDSQLVIRLDKDVRNAFIDLCKSQDTSASREIRGFIRDYLKQNGG